MSQRDKLASLPPERLVMLAQRVLALSNLTPARRAARGHSVYVPWWLIEDVRADLAELGIDWLSAKAEWEALSAKDLPK